jgi:hypothetical protein
MFLLRARLAESGDVMSKLIPLLFLFGESLVVAQGTVTFANDSSSLSAPPDRLVRYQGTPVSSNSNPGLRVQLYYGASTAEMSSLVAVTSAPSMFKNSTSPNVGTWFTVLGVPLNGFNPGETVNLQVRVWDIGLASSYEIADSLAGAGNYNGLIGESSVFRYTIPSAPAVPSDYTMQNFRSFDLGALVNRPLVPEPSSIGLLLLAGGLFVGARLHTRE